MSTTILYKTRVVIDPQDAEGNRVLVQVGSRDNNMVQLSGRHSDGAYLETIKTLNRDLPDQAAEFFESLAEGYDGGGIREGAIRGDSGVLAGERAYNLWANRFEKATGVKLRPPRLDAITYGGIPHYLFQAPPAKVQVKKGDALSLTQAAEIIKSKHEIQIEVSPGQKRRLGFISTGGEVCCYAKGKRRLGNALYAPVTVAENFDSWEGKPGIEHAQAIVSDAMQKDADAWFVKGTSRGKNVFLERSNPGFCWSYHTWDHTILAGFKDRAVALKALGILQATMPEVEPKIIPTSELPASLAPNPALVVTAAMPAQKQVVVATTVLPDVPGLASAGSSKVTSPVHKQTSLGI